MRAAAFACFVLGALLVVATFTFAVAGIWLNDPRWGWTAFAFGSAGALAGVLGTALADMAPHRK